MGTLLKRYFLVFCALVALAACESETEYKDIRLPAYRADIFYGTPIASADELARIGSGNKNYPLDGEYYLTADIDLSGYEPWRPIGTDIAPFTGILNGNGRTIRGLTLGGGAAMYTGLFGYLQGARVTNVTVEFDNELSETVTMTATVNQYFRLPHRRRGRQLEQQLRACDRRDQHEHQHSGQLRRPGHGGTDERRQRRKLDGRFPNAQQHGGLHGQRKPAADAGILRDKQPRLELQHGLGMGHGTKPALPTGQLT